MGLKIFGRAVAVVVLTLMAAMVAAGIAGNSAYSAEQLRFTSPTGEVRSISELSNWSCHWTDTEGRQRNCVEKLSINTWMILGRAHAQPCLFGASIQTNLGTVKLCKK